MPRGPKDLFGPSFLDDPFAPRRVPHVRPGAQRALPRRAPASPPRQPAESGQRRVPVDPTIGEPPSLTDFDVPVREADLDRVGRALDAREPEPVAPEPDERAESVARTALARVEAKAHFDEELSRAKHRFDREARREIARQKRETIAPFLEVLDDVDRALAASDEASGSMREGVEMIRDRFLATLRDQGVTPMEVDGAPFDPERHEAMSVVPVTDPSLDNVVVGVIRAGYMLDGDVLRPAGVAVGRLS